MQCLFEIFVCVLIIMLISVYCSLYESFFKNQEVAPLITSFSAGDGNIKMQRNKKNPKQNIK